MAGELNKFYYEFISNSDYPQKNAKAFESYVEEVAGKGTFKTKDVQNFFVAETNRVMGANTPRYTTASAKEINQLLKDTASKANPNPGMSFDELEEMNKDFEKRQERIRNAKIREKGLKIMDDGKAMPVDSKGNVANNPQQRAIQRVENFNVVEEGKYWTAKGRKGIEEAIQGIKNGVATTPQAQRFMRYINTPQGATAMRALPYVNKALGAAGIALSAPFSIARVKEKWDAPGANWATRAAEVADAAIPWISGALGGFGGVLLGGGGAAASQVGLDQYYNRADMSSVVKDPTLAAVAQEGFNNPSYVPQGAVDSADNLINQYNQSNQELAQEEQATINAKQALQAAQANYDMLQAQAGNAGATPPPTTPAAPTTPSGDGGNGNNVEVAEMQDVQNIPALAPTVLDYTNLEGLGDYGLQVGTPTGLAAAAEYDPVAEKFKDMILNPLDQPGAMSQEEIRAQLNDIAQQQQALIAADPRYQGEVLTPGNPYTIDEDMLKFNQAAAYLSTARTNPAALPDLQKQQALEMYQAQLANQAGVPYEDYIAATTAQREQQIAALGTQRENILKQQAAQSTNMKEMIEYLQKLRENEKDIQKAIIENRMKGQYDLEQARITARGNLDVAQTNVAGNLAINTQNLPYKTMGAYGTMMGGLGYHQGPAQAAFMVQAPDVVQNAMRIKGLDIDQALDMFKGGSGLAAQQQPRPTFQGFNFFGGNSSNQ